MSSRAWVRGCLMQPDHDLSLAATAASGLDLELAEADSGRADSPGDSWPLGGVAPATSRLQHPS